ncbi:MAG: polysaccharide deacetylase family protein [Candidatus Xenobia bacterium]
MKIVWALLGLVVMGLAAVITIFLWYGFIGNDFDAAYEAQQPMVITPGMDWRLEQRQAIDRSWGLLLNDALVRGGWKQPVDHGPRLVALTFDDGPYPMYTSLLLDELKQQNVPATFFVIGREAEANPALIKRMVDEGHEVANHSFTHRTMIHLSASEIRYELSHTREILHAITGYDTSLVRPPGGRTTPELMQILKEGGYTLVLWNNNPGDWMLYDPERVYSLVFRTVMDRQILLMHNGRIATLRQLPAMVAEFRRLGFRFVTVRDYARAIGIALDH